MCKKFVYRCTLIMLLASLFACSEEEDALVSSDATLSIVINRAELDAQGAPCYNTAGAVDAAVYMYQNSPTRPDDFDGNAPEPIAVFRLTEPDATAFSATIKFDSTGNYSLAVVCGVSTDNVQSNDSLTYLSNRRYAVAIKDTTGLLVTANQPITHPLHTSSDPGCFTCQVCFGCHIQSPNFLVTQTNHRLVLGDCLDCHSNADNAVAMGQPVNNHISTPTDQSCSECHHQDIWVN